MTPEQIVRMCEAMAEGHRRRDTQPDERTADFDALVGALMADRFPFNCIHDNFAETCAHCNAWRERYTVPPEQQSAP